MKEKLNKKVRDTDNEDEVREQSSAEKQSKFLDVLMLLVLQGEIIYYTN